MRISEDTHMFTLADAVKLMNSAEGKKGLTPEALQKDSALLGDYVLTDSQALTELERIRSGKHALDNPKGMGLGSLAGGKLPSHPTFSNESPYYIKGFASAEGGSWDKQGPKWNYTPSNEQIKRDPNYLDGLMHYFSREKGNGIDSITLPNGAILK